MPSPSDCVICGAPRAPGAAYVCDRVVCDRLLIQTLLTVLHDARAEYRSVRELFAQPWAREVLPPPLMPRPSSGPLYGLDADYAALLRADPCAYCGGPGGVLDHIVPVIAGGPDGAENLTGACGRCNSSKSGRPLLAYLAR